MLVKNRWLVFDCRPFISLPIGIPNDAKPENPPRAMAWREQHVTAGIKIAHAGGHFVIVPLAVEIQNRLTA